MFDLKIDDKKQTKRISSKILKMAENNQYGMAMTKPLPYGCIKKENNPLVEFHQILVKISHNNTIGHIFIADIKVHNVNPKTLLFNELYPQIFEKDNNIKPFKQSTLQLLNVLVRNENTEKINSVRCNSKTHSTLKVKKLITLYVEDLHFLITRVGCLVTHIYRHFRFEQSKFKKDFVIMN